MRVTDPVVSDQDPSECVPDMTPLEYVPNLEPKLLTPEHPPWPEGPTS